MVSEYQKRVAENAGKYEHFRVRSKNGATGTCRSYYTRFEINWDCGSTEECLDLSDIGVSKINPSYLLPDTPVGQAFWENIKRD